MMSKLQQWWKALKEYNSSTHALAFLAVAVGLAYGGYPPFRALVTSVYEWFPSWAQALIGTVGYLTALYKSGVLKLPKGTVVLTDTPVVPAIDTKAEVPASITIDVVK